MLADPARLLVAESQSEVSALLEEIDREQAAGRYVAGYLSYEAGAAFGLTVLTQGGSGHSGSPSTDASTSPALPMAWMAAYDSEHATVIPASEWGSMLAAVDVAKVADSLAGVEPDLSVSRDDYVEAIGRVREYIAAGDTYQVNYTVRGRYDLGRPEGAPTTQGAGDDEAADNIDPLDYFLALAIRQPVPYAAYFDLGEAQVISLSPEMFLRRQGRTLESRPMKGTRPRGATHPEDVALAYELAETEKERAENLMIVDMVRNDLGRVCRAGSVHVPTLYAVEPYRTVWQMVSTVTGDVNRKATLPDIMQAVFPGASITGAPKHHTMEIIAELETEPREVYTGAVGLFLPGGDFTTNIAIRTIIHRQGRCKLGTGSGVVWDADAAAEYDETLVKATFATPPIGGPWRPEPQDALRDAAAQEDFFLLETVLLQAADRSIATGESGGANGSDSANGPSGALGPLHAVCDDATLSRYLFLREHLERLTSSARALSLPLDSEAIRDLLVGLARVHPEALVVRVQLGAAGHLSFSTREAPTPLTDPVKLLVSPFRTDPDDPFLRHKTSHRGFYNREHRRALGEDCFDALFLNRLDHVTEGAITNVFARFGDVWLTPPLEDGLLPGVWRADFMRENGAMETPLSLADLQSAQEVVVGNSVRQAVRVTTLIADPLVF